MSVLETLNDIGINPVMATKLMTKLNISPDELDIPYYFNMFKDVAQFFSKYENSEYIINKVTFRHSDDSLSKLWEYVQVQQNREQLEKSIESLDGELSILGKIPEAEHRIKELEDKKFATTAMLDQNKKEIQMYER